MSYWCWVCHTVRESEGVTTDREGAVICGRCEARLSRTRSDS
jgi:hypothetical protein